MKNGGNIMSFGFSVYFGLDNTKEENIKLKTKVKILEAEMGRKERAIEDFYT